VADETISPMKSSDNVVLGNFALAFGKVELL
jgi:hypothetical protein